MPPSQAMVPLRQQLAQGGASSGELAQALLHRGELGGPQLPDLPAGGAPGVALGEAGCDLLDSEAEGEDAADPEDLGQRLGRIEAIVVGQAAGPGEEPPPLIEAQGVLAHPGAAGQLAGPQGLPARLDRRVLGVLGFLGHGSTLNDGMGSRVKGAAAPGGWEPHGVRYDRENAAGDAATEVRGPADSRRCGYASVGWRVLGQVERDGESLIELEKLAGGESAYIIRKL